MLFTLISVVLFLFLRSLLLRLKLLCFIFAHVPKYYSIARTESYSCESSFAMISITTLDNCHERNLLCF